MSLSLYEKTLAIPLLSHKRFNGIFSRHALLASAVAVALTIAGGGDAFAKNGAGGGGGGGTAKPRGCPRRSRHPHCLTRFLQTRLRLTGLTLPALSRT